MLNEMTKFNIIMRLPFYIDNNNIKYSFYSSHELAGEKNLGMWINAMRTDSA